MNRLAREFFEADVRGLALFRVVFGLVLVGSLVESSLPMNVATYLADDGVVPRAWLLSSPTGARSFSLFLASGQAPALRAMLLGLVLAAIAFTVGYRTRLAAVALLVGFGSLAVRNPFVWNGGHFAIQILLLLSLTLPLGARYGVDARAGRGGTFPAERVRTLAVFVFRLQWAALYLLAALQKSGRSWHEGSAIARVLSDEAYARAWVVSLAPTIPASLTRAATFATVAVELAIAGLVLMPLFPATARRIATGLITGLHLLLVATLALGPFSAVLASASLLLAASGDFDRLDARLPRFVRWRAAGPLEVRSRRLREGLREAYVLGLAVFLGTLLRVDPPLVVRRLGAAHPHASVAALRSFLVVDESWNLFAPSPPARTERVVVELVLRDGRRIDPFTHAPPDLRSTRRPGRTGTVRFVGIEHALLTHAHDRALIDAFLDHACRIPALERWRGERRVDVVRLHVVSRSLLESGEPVTSEVFVERRGGGTTVVLPLRR